MLVSQYLKIVKVVLHLEVPWLDTKEPQIETTILDDKWYFTI